MTTESVVIDFMNVFYSIFTHDLRYMIKYHSDDAFDNMYIDSNLKRLWKEEGYEKLTPIRNWERKEKYQMTSTFKCLKLSRKDIWFLHHCC